MNFNTVELLLVEDNETDAELTIRELRKHNLANNLLHLKDGEEALDFLYARGGFEGKRDMQFLPRLILLDIQMPKINGIEVLQQVKSHEKLQSIPIVILTSSKESPDVKLCYSKGANSYIVKPVVYESFASSIQQLGLYWLTLNQSCYSL